MLPLILTRCSEYEAVLEGYNKEVESFRKKDVMTMEEMKNNVEKFNELSKNLDFALAEYEVSLLRFLFQNVDLMLLFIT